MKYSITFLALIFSSFVFSQSVNTSGVVSPTIGGESVFLDASSFSGIGSNLSRGLVFPRTDLTSFTFISEGSSFGNFATGYDGMIVYNTGNGTTPGTGSGIGNQDIEPGFYYFSNTSSNGATATGEWLPFVGGSDTKTVVNSTVNETTTIINGTPVNVIRLPGEANGTTTEMDLKTTVLPANSVGELRKAIIYDNTGKLLMTATSDYNSTTNVFTTGDGMVNKLLPAATDYVVELYFLPTTTP